MNLLNKEFVRNYLDLTYLSINSKRLSIILFIETVAAVFTLLAVCLFGLLIQLLLSGATLSSSSLGKLTHYLPSLDWFNNLDQFELILVIALTSIITGTAALVIEFLSLKFVRKTARHAYSDSLNQHLTAFRKAPSSLTLSPKGFKNFRSSFTIDAHITFTALEAILKCFRPIAYIAVFSLAVLVLQAKALLIIIVFILISAPFIASLYRKTLSSAKGILGEQRKTIYAEIMSHIDKIDSYEQANGHRKMNDQPFIPQHFSLMLDSFDSWKLSSDKANYTLQTLKILAVHLVIISIAWAAHLDHTLELSGFVLLALIIFKLLISLINLMTRLTVLSRLFPIVNRYLTVVDEVSNARDDEPLDHTKTTKPVLPDSIWLGIATPPVLRKSEMGLLSKCMDKFYPGYNLARLARQKSGTIGDFTHKDVDLQNVLNTFIKESKGITSDSFKQFLNNLNPENGSTITNIDTPIDSETTWKRASPEMRVMLNLLILIYDSSVDYIICRPATVDKLKCVLDTNSFTTIKPIVTFDRNIEIAKKQPFDAILKLPKKRQTQMDEFL